MNSRGVGKVVYVAALLSTWLCVGGVHAAEEGPNVGDKEVELKGEALATQRAHLAHELAAYGRETRDAMALIVAADILSSVGGNEVEREKSTEDLESANPAAEEAEDKDASEEVYSVSSLLADARALARGDEALVKAADQVASQEQKGRVPGPAYSISKVNALSHDWYRARFRGGEPAIVAVVGDGDTDLDLRIYDQNGNLICADTDYSDRNLCRWTPRWTGEFRIRITNLGRVWNQYQLRTN